MVAALQCRCDDANAVRGDQPLVLAGVAARVLPDACVRAGNGQLPSADAQAMVDAGPRVSLVELADAEHDLHLHRPAQWRAALCAFLDALESASASAESLGRRR
jgi:hypothetical protein